MDQGFIGTSPADQAVDYLCACGFFDQFCDSQKALVAAISQQNDRQHGAYRQSSGKGRAASRQATG